MDSRTNENSSEDVVKLTVDQNKCIGSGQCEMLEEATFLIDDDSVVAGVIGSGTLPRDRAERVVSICPTESITIVE